MGSLHRCLDVSRYKQFLLLIKLPGTKLDLRDEVGRTAMHRCALLDDEDTAIRLILMLLTHHADPYAIDNHGRSALHYACQRGHYRLAEVLLEVIPELDAGKADCFGNDALHYAAATGDDRLVALLLHQFVQHCTNVDRPNAFGFTPLLIAASNGHQRAASLLANVGSACCTRRDGVYFMSASEWLAVFFRGADTRHLAFGQEAHLSPRDAAEVLEIASTLTPASLKPKQQLTQRREYDGVGHEVKELPVSPRRSEQKLLQQQQLLPSEQTSSQHKTGPAGVLCWQKIDLKKKGQPPNGSGVGALQLRPMTAPVRVQLQRQHNGGGADDEATQPEASAAAPNCPWPRCTSARTDITGTSRKSHSAWALIQELATIQPQQLSPSYRTTAVNLKPTSAAPQLPSPEIVHAKVRDHVGRQRR